MDTKEISELLLRVYDYLTNEDWCGIENPVFTDEDFNLLRKFISVVCEKDLTEEQIEKIIEYGCNRDCCNCNCYVDGIYIECPKEALLRKVKGSYEQEQIKKIY